MPKEFSIEPKVKIHGKALVQLENVANGRTAGEVIKAALNTYYAVAPYRQPNGDLIVGKKGKLGIKTKWVTLVIP